MNTTSPQPAAWQFGAAFWQKLESVPADLRNSAVPLYYAPAVQAPEGGPALIDAARAVLATYDKARREKYDEMCWAELRGELFEELRAALAAPAPQAAPVITEAEIDRIAALTEKAMEEGLRGFCRTWGWQQFARTLVENLRPYGLRIISKEPTNDR